MFYTEAAAVYTHVPEKYLIDSIRAQGYTIFLNSPPAEWTDALRNDTSIHFAGLPPAPLE